jgi:thiosulfate/3-mercaptopyruvate sulfurtransferase
MAGEKPMKLTKVCVLSLVFILPSVMVHAGQLPGPLVETGWLAKNSKKVVILAVRKDTKSFTTRPRFRKDKKSGKTKLVKVGGHIPGATLVDYKQVRTKRTIDGRTVSKLIPEKAAFESLMQKSGVNQDSAIVVVSKGENGADMTTASRLYWQIKYFGHENVAILNGGTAQWIVDNRPVSSKASSASKGNWKAVTERSNILATSNDVAAGMKTGVQLVDTRPLSQYLGTTKKSYVYASGHIPGAKVFPNELVTSVSMPARFTTLKDFRKLNAAMGIKTNAKTITYCNSGHLATGTWFLMHEIAGNKNVKMYDGSMHQWTLEKRPVTSMKME